MTKTEIKQNTYAAIDLGSNSFHMLVAEPEGDLIKVIDGLRLPVRLGDGLDKQKHIKPATEEAALDAIGQFAQRLQGVPRQNVRIVGTNTLRRATNSKQFIEAAFKILRKRIEIISGREEARLIYSAVSHGLPAPDRSRLVIDIGGGSTEIILGLGFKPSVIESTNMGCVSFTNTFIPDDKITAAAVKSSIVNAQLELQPISKAYIKKGWDEVIGCSGTIKATSNALRELKISDGTITRSGIKKLQKLMIDAASIEKLNLESISKNRSQVFVGGVTILYAIMKTLDIEEMQASQVALREGLIFELIGKKEHADVQLQTIENLASRYHIDEIQALRVAELTDKLFDIAKKEWELDEETDRTLLHWAARIHEIGLSVAHSQYHKHGAYLIENSDLLGFSRNEQAALAMLVRFHRRKISTDSYSTLPETEREHLIRLTALLRLAVLLQRSRHEEDLIAVDVTLVKNELKLMTTDAWLEAHPLTTADLEYEAKHLTGTGIELSVWSH